MHPHLIVEGSVAILPVCHYRVEFAQLVVAAAAEWAPEAIAVELPGALEAAAVAAVDRLPYLSAVVYRPEEEPFDGRRGYLLVEPADPIVEALRQGRERGLEVRCVDANVFDYADRDDRLPDPYAVVRVGHRAYFEEADAARFAREAPDAHDAHREAVMAYRVSELARGGRRVLFVCGMAHARRVARRIAAGGGSPFGVPSPGGAERIDAGAQVYDLHPDSSREVMAEWAYLSAAYERARAPRGGEAAPEERPAPRIISFASRRRLEAELEELLAGPAPGPAPALPVDRQVVAFDLFKAAAARYEQDTGDRVGPQQMRVLMKYLRNWALVRGRLQPDFFQLVVGARGAVDDNFAYEVWDVGTYYPWQDPSGALPALRLRVEDLYDEKRTIHFHRRLKTRRKRPLLVPVRERKRERRPGEWAEAFDGTAICSYPPEDVVVENFGGYLKKKAKSVLSEEQSRTEPFTTSVLDGIDVRETIRNWHEGRLYVREHQKVRGDVGSVVVVFDEDRETERYPWLMTWLGEHEQESDMALYATDPAETIVGPGISRAEYGGFMMTYPPRRVADVWEDPFYRDARSKAEVLLMAAVDYSVERLVVYVAADPPRTAMKRWAARFGKKIVYVPIGQLSPVTLKKLRVFHVLSGHDKRRVAKDYIW
jgi:hypothetical protein